MFETPLNMKTVTLKLKRIEVCDLMLACAVIMDSPGSGSKWEVLHNKLKGILDDFDKQHTNEVKL